MTHHGHQSLPVNTANILRPDWAEAFFASSKSTVKPLGTAAETHETANEAARANTVCLFIVFVPF